MCTQQAQIYEHYGENTHFVPMCVPVVCKYLKIFIWTTNRFKCSKLKNLYKKTFLDPYIFYIWSKSIKLPPKIGFLVIYARKKKIRAKNFFHAKVYPKTYLWRTGFVSIRHIAKCAGHFVVSLCFKITIFIKLKKNHVFQNDKNC